MIKNEKITVSISYRNIGHYLRLGYSPIINKNLEIRTMDLPSVSHVKIDVLCSICNKENKIMFCKFLENSKRHGFYGCKKCSRQKAVLTSRKIYGVDNWMQLEEAKKIIEENNIKKYGVKTTLLVPSVKESIKKTLLEKYGTENFYEIRDPNTNKFVFKDIDSQNFDYVNPVDKYEDICYDSYLRYRSEVRKLTKQKVGELLESWDGCDFYDGEYIIENFNLPFNDKKFPTIDHKISVNYGYKNNISVEEISDISNLCFTKRSINSKKRDSLSVDVS
jgi:hypothetical protein